MASDPSETEANDSELGVSLSSQGAQLLEEGRAAEAEPLLRRALAIAEAASPWDEEVLIGRIELLAHALHALGRHAEVKALMVAAMKLAEEMMEASTGTPLTRLAAEDLADAAEGESQQDALALLDELLAEQEAGVGERRSVLATVLDHLAEILARPQEAEPLLRRVLALEEERRRPGHPNIAGALSLLGKVLAQQGRSGAAFEAFERAAAIHGESPDGLPSQLLLAHEVSRLSLATARAGRKEEAIVLAAWALRIHEQDLEAQVWVVSDLNHLGTLLNEGGLVEEAERARRRALATAEAVLHPLDRNLGTTLNNLGCQLVEMGRPDEAEPLLRRALAIAEAAQPPDPERVADRLEMLAEALRRQGRPEEAAALLPAPPPKYPVN